MKDNKFKITPVQQSSFGLYVWEMPDGRIVADEDGNWLNIPSEVGDRRKIKMLEDAARYYGLYEGKAVFMPGRRRITEEEYEEQKMRLEAGLTPDIYDAGALLDELAYNKAMNNR